MISDMTVAVTEDCCHLTVNQTEQPYYNMESIIMY